MAAVVGDQEIDGILIQVRDSEEDAPTLAEMCGYPAQEGSGIGDVLEDVRQRDEIVRSRIDRIEAAVELLDARQRGHGISPGVAQF